MPKRTRLVLALCAGCFLVLLDVTIVNVALPRIAEVPATGSAGLAWVVDAYAFPLAGLLSMPGSGRDSSASGWHSEGSHCRQGRCSVECSSSGSDGGACSG